MTMICSMSGVPRMTHTKVLTAPDSTLQRLMEPKATTSPQRQRKQQRQGKQLTVEQERAGKAPKDHRHNNTPIPSDFAVSLGQGQIVLVGQSLHGAVSLQLVKGGIHGGGRVAALAEGHAVLFGVSSSTIFRLA